MLGEIYKGKFTKKQLEYWIFTTGLIYLSLMLTAYALYPNKSEFSMYTHLLSSFGDWNINPNGWYIFTIAQIFISVYCYPLFLFIQNELKITNLKKISVGTKAFILACIGMSLVGIFPDIEDSYIGSMTIEQIHTIIALLQAAVYITAMCCYCTFILKHKEVDYLIDENGDPIKWLRKDQETASAQPEINNAGYRKRKINFKPVMPAVYIYVVVFVGTIITQLYGEIFLDYPYTGIFSRPIWEWGLYLVFFVYIYPMLYSLIKSRWP